MRRYRVRTFGRFREDHRSFGTALVRSSPLTDTGQSKTLDEDKRFLSTLIVSVSTSEVTRNIVLNGYFVLEKHSILVPLDSPPLDVKKHNITYTL